jgi:hypothetical protein
VSKTLLIVFGFVLAGGIAAGLFFVKRSNADRGLEELIQDIRASGAPVTLEELDAFYDKGADAQAGKSLATLLGLIHPIPDSADLLVVPGVGPDETIPAKMIDDTRRYVGEHRDITGRLHEILADSPQARYPADLKLGADTPLEHLAPVRSGTRLLAQEASLAAIDGNAPRATNSLISAFRLADSLRTEPLVISQLVRIACMGVAYVATQDVINRCAIGPADLARLQQEIAGIGEESQIAGAMLGERVWGMADVIGESAASRRMLDLSREALDQNNFDGSKLDSPAYLRTEVLQLTRDYGDLIELGTIAPEDRLAAADNLAARISSRPDDGNLLSKTFLPDEIRTFEAENRLIAQLRCTIAGLAALRHHAEKKARPTSLDNLVPAYLDTVPIDPFTGTPLRFRTVGSGFIIYSVGPNGADDLGHPPPEGTSIGDAGDIAFRVVSSM